MPDIARHQRGLLDTTVVIDLETVSVDALPEEVAICAITLAALAAVRQATTDAVPAEGLPVYTRNPDHFRSLDVLVEVISV